jgi:hypothetical protein
MKKAIIAILALTLHTAQAQTETKTLFNSNSVKSYGAFLGAGIQSGQIYNTNTFFYNLRAGAVINDAWSLGLVFGENVDEFNVNVSNGFGLDFNELDMYYYGAFVEYRLKPHNLIYFSFPLQLGVLESDFYAENFIPGLDDDYDVDADDYQFFVEPGVNIELNVHQFVRLYAGASYRFQAARLYTDGFTPPAPENHLMFNLGLKIGVFNFKSL